MISYTASQIIDLCPCPEWPLDRIQAVFASHGRQGQAVPLLDILHWDDVPVEDRIWVALQGGPHIRPFLDRVVERAVRTHALPHAVTREWAEKWLSGEDRSAETAWEVAAVWESAEAALATWLAAESAVWESSESARSALATAELAEAAWPDRWAERRQQLQDLIEVVEGHTPVTGVLRTDFKSTESRTGQIVARIAR